MKQKILVTGAAGFIGSFLCQELLAKNNFVLGVDNFFRGKKANLQEFILNKNFVFKKIDLSSPRNISRLKQLIIKHKITTVYHLAAVNGTQYFYDKSFFVLDQNTKITQNLLAALQNTKVNYLLYTSSSEVYSDPLTIPTNEEHPILLNAASDRDSYAASKAIGEFYIRLFAEKNKISYLILRVFNMYGERMVNTRYGQVIPEFIQRMLHEDKFTIIGDGGHSRSFCYIKDAIWAMRELLEKKVTGILNIGNDSEISILKLAKKIHALEHRSFQPIFLPERPYDHKRRKPDISKLKLLIPELKFTDLDIGLKKVIRFYKLQ